jgi:hypothetical protein
MAKIHYLSLHTSQSLGPEDLRKVVEAFELALHGLTERPAPASAYSERQAVARFIVEAAFRGERDPQRLANAALGRLTGIGKPREEMPRVGLDIAVQHQAPG